jgi:mRNA interferase HigB
MDRGHVRDERPAVRVISKRRLVEFWASRKAGDESRLAERDLTSWLTLAKGADWDNFGALKQTFGTADAVGNCVVFDVGNNRFRLVGRINYHAHVIYVLKVMDHAEYDRNSWVDSCGCNDPPPARPDPSRPPSRARKSAPRKSRR